MNRSKTVVVFTLLVLVLALGATACKHSGVAVTKKGQIMEIDIEGANDLPDGYSDSLHVSVQNRGPNNIHDVEFTVEIPAELVVLGEKHGDGMNMMEMRSPDGNRIFHYKVGDIEPMNESDVEFQVRTSFGTRDRTGDIKVTAWADDLPSDRLVETRAIKLRR